MSFSVHLDATDPLGGYVWGADPATLVLTPTYWSKDRRGGYLSAEITVMGAPSHLWDVLSWLRRPIEILSDGGQELWAGFVNEVEITTQSGAVSSVDLDGMANRIAVAYAYELAGGGYDRGTTDWGENAESVRRFGKKDYLHIQGEGESDSAETTRDKLLAALSKPRRNRTFREAGAAASARLLCLGWAQTLKWRKWTRTGSRLEFVATGGADNQAVGWGLQDTTIGFTRNLSAIHDITGRLQALRADNVIAVTGTAQSNNGTYTVTGPTDAEAQEYTAETIWFEPDNDIKDSQGGLGFLRKGALFLLMYSPNNSGVHRVSDAGDEAIEIDVLFSDFVTAESVGPSIYIKQGNEALLYPRPANIEAPGSLITVTLYGHRIAQQVTLDAATNVGRIGVQVARVGVPGDSIRCAIYSNVSGSPGSSLASATITGSELQEDDPAWVWFKWSGGGVALAAGTYWIVLERTGSASPTAYYQVGMTSAPYLACKAYTGAAWVPNPTGAYVPFKLWAVEETTATIRGIADAAGELIAAVKIDNASGVWANPEQTGDASAFDVIDKLIEMGTAAGARLFWEVTRDRTLRIFQEPDYDYRPLMLGADGALRNAGGALAARGELPVGRYLAIEDVPEALGLWPVMIDAAQYSADQDSIQLQPKEDGNVIA